MGVFEMEKFAKGTNAVAEMLADLTQKHGARWKERELRPHQG